MRERVVSSTLVGSLLLLGPSRGSITCSIPVIQYTWHFKDSFMNECSSVVVGVLSLRSMYVEIDT